MMRLIKRVALLVLCLCLLTSSAFAMGLNITQPENWELRVSWSERLDVAKIVLCSGSRHTPFATYKVSSGTSIILKEVPPQVTYRVKAYDAAGNMIAEGGEVTGSVDKWGKYGAVTGLCEIVRRTNADTSKNIWEVSHPTVTTITGDLLDQYMQDGIHFYLHWKVQFKKKSEPQTFRQDLVMHTPSGAIYMDSWMSGFDTGLNPNGYWNCYDDLSDRINSVFNQYRSGRDAWETGDYVFRIYADGQYIKECTLKVK